MEKTNQTKSAATPSAVVAQRLAVCSWSLQTANADELVAKIGETRIRNVQLALDRCGKTRRAGGARRNFWRGRRTPLCRHVGCVARITLVESIRRTADCARRHGEQNLANISAT
jgi:hypothetical protein